jgi:hypothetical protein
MRRLCLLLLALPAAAAPSVRWIDVKGDIHVDEVREIVEESPSAVRARLADGSERAFDLARVLDVVRERDEVEEERTLLAARKDAAAGVRLDAACATLDRLAQDGSEPWIREYAAASRALLAELRREDGALERLQRFLDDHPESRFLSDAISALGRVKARAAGRDSKKMMDAIMGAHRRIRDLGGPIALRFRAMSDMAERVVSFDPGGVNIVLGPIQQGLAKELPENDYGAYLLFEAEAKWAQLLCYRRAAAFDEKAGREPRGALDEVQRLQARSGLDLPDVRSDIERELGRLQLACGDKEGARGALERARDLAPDAHRREAAEALLRGLEG